MNVFVDTSVWSRAWRRDASDGHEVELLRTHLKRGDVVTTGLVVQELLQGFAGPRSRKTILDRLEDVPVVHPEVRDHVQAAELRNHCRRKGVQVGTIDALLAQLCIRHELSLLTADRDFEGIARFTTLQLTASPR